MTAAFQASDTWLLVALLHATEGRPTASLSALIRAGDVVNHAIFSQPELEAGFTRLVAAGHVACTAEGFSPSVAIRAFWEENTDSWKSLYASWHHLAVHIGAAQSPIAQAAEATHERYVSKAAYSAAVSAHAVNMSHPLQGER